MSLCSDARVQTLANAPLFVLGVPRSGTTWVQRILLAHPQVCGGQESHFFRIFGAVLRSFYSTGRSQRKAGLYWYWDEAKFKQEILHLWYQTIAGVVTASPEATLLVEKTPDHSDYIPEICQLLPQARFIHVIRDSRSVAASLLAASQESWGERWAPNTAQAAAIYWRTRIEKARRDGNQLPATTYLEIHYEDLIANTLAQSQVILEFCGLTMPEAELQQVIAQQSFANLAAQNQTRTTPSTVQALATEPKGFFRQGRADSWKTDLNWLQQLIIWWHTRQTMRTCGYTWQGRSLPTPSPSLR